MARFTAPGSSGVQTGASGTVTEDFAMSLVDVERLREIAEVEFADIVADGYVSDLNELRLILIEGSFI